jgi:hypothetical protein
MGLGVLQNRTSLFEAGTCWPDLALPGGDPIGVERQVLIGKPHD